MEFLNWILVPVDFSLDSCLALQAADADAARWESGLILMHVQTPRSPEEVRWPPQEDETLRSWAARVRKTPRENVFFISTEGDPSEKIIAIAEDLRVRSVYMGRGGTVHSPGVISTAVQTALPETVHLISHLTFRIRYESQPPQEAVAAHQVVI